MDIIILHIITPHSTAFVWTSIHVIKPLDEEFLHFLEMCWLICYRLVSNKLWQLFKAIYLQYEHLKWKYNSSCKEILTERYPLHLSSEEVFGNQHASWLLDWMHTTEIIEFTGILNYSIYSHIGVFHQRKRWCYISLLLVTAFRFTCMGGKYISFHSYKCQIHIEKNWALLPETKQCICRKESISALSKTYFKGRR